MNQEQPQCAQHQHPTSPAMMGVALLFGILAVYAMQRYSKQTGVWWGIGFFLLGGTIGSRVGRIIQPPKTKCG